MAGWFLPLAVPLVLACALFPAPSAPDSADAFGLAEDPPAPTADSSEDDSTPRSAPKETATKTDIPLPRPAHADAGWIPVVVNTFEDGKAAFRTGTVESSGGGILDAFLEDGTFVWRLTSGTQYIGIGRTVDAPVDIFEDFYASVVGKQTKGPADCEYGFYFRVDRGSAFTFSIRERMGTFDFDISTAKMSEYELYDEHTYSPAIQTEGPNTLAVKAVGSEVAVYINDELVRQIQNEHLLSGRIGLQVFLEEPHAEAEFVFDDFLLYTP